MSIQSRREEREGEMYSIQFNRRLCGYIEKSRRPTADHVTRGEAAAPSFFFYFLLSIFLKSPGLLLSSCPYSSASLSLSLCVHNNCIAQIYSELREREGTGCGKERKKKTIGRGQRMSCLLVCLMGWRRSWTGSGREKRKATWRNM